MGIESKIMCYGDHIDTDAIIAARYLNITDMQALAGHCMADIDPEFQNKVIQKKIIVAGRNFGCGSSREHAPAVLKSAGIECVIADSFARIFFRNAINIGLPIIECESATKALKEGQRVTILLDEGSIYCHETKQTYYFPPFPIEIQRIIDAGGLINSIHKNA